MLATLGSIASQGGLPDNVICQGGKINEKYRLVMDRYYLYGGTDQVGIEPSILVQGGRECISYTSTEQTGGSWRTELRSEFQISKGLYTHLYVEVQAIQDNSDTFWLQHADQGNFGAPIGHTSKTAGVFRSSLQTYPINIHFRSNWPIWLERNTHNRLNIFKIWLE